MPALVCVTALNLLARHSSPGRLRYTDYPGKWMCHCHIMDHEDQGMLGILEVHRDRRTA